MGCDNSRTCEDIAIKSGVFFDMEQCNRKGILREFTDGTLIYLCDEDFKIWVKNGWVPVDEEVNV